MSKELDELKKKQEELGKQITDLAESEQRQEEERLREERRLENERLTAKRIEEEKHRDEIRAKRIKLFHLGIDIKIIRSVFLAIHSIQNEAVFHLKKKNITVVGVDPAHVALYSINIPKGAMDKYSCKADHDIGVNIEQTLKVLKRRRFKGKKSSHQVMFDEYQEDNELNVSWNTKHGFFRRTVELIDTAGIPVSTIPSIILPAKFDASTDGLIEFLKEASDVSDHISITTSDKGVRFEAKGDEDVVEYVIPGVNLKPFCSLFSIDYFMSAIVVMKSFFKKVTIRISTDNPVEIKGEGVVDMLVLLAPRIEAQ